MRKIIVSNLYIESKIINCRGDMRMIECHPNDGTAITERMFSFSFFRDHGYQLEWDEPKYGGKFESKGFTTYQTHDDRGYRIQENSVRCVIDEQTGEDSYFDGP